MHGDMARSRRQHVETRHRSGDNAWRCDTEPETTHGDKTWDSGMMRDPKARHEGKAKAWDLDAIITRTRNTHKNTGIVPEYVTTSHTRTYTIHTRARPHAARTRTQAARHGPAVRHAPAVGAPSPPHGSAPRVLQRGAGTAHRAPVPTRSDRCGARRRYGLFGEIL